MNFQRKSTVGWSIGNIILDLVGGLTNFAQMAVQSLDQGLFPTCMLLQRSSPISLVFHLACFFNSIELILLQVHGWTSMVTLGRPCFPWYVMTISLLVLHPYCLPIFFISDFTHTLGRPLPWITYCTDFNLLAKYFFL